MSRINDAMAKVWMRVGTRFLPFADAATADLPLSRLLRLSLFQVSVGVAMVLLNGTLNRVMIVELDVPSWLVALMVSLPLAFAPLRALIGFRSDTHRSVLGWRRVPYIWIGTLLQFGGLAIMPFALLVLSGDGHGPVWSGQLGAALAFLLVGAGLHTTQTAGLALATDLAPERVRPRVVALLYVMLLVGVAGSSLLIGALLAQFSALRLIQVIQGAAVLTIALNVIALWKQEARDPGRTRRDLPRPAFRSAWRALTADRRTSRFLVAVGLGAAAFSMQDILLEPYGGQVMRMSVGATTQLTGLLAGGTLLAFALAARALARGHDCYRLSAFGAVTGLFAFAAVIFAAPLASPMLLRIGTAAIGFGGGLFSVGTLTAAMALQRRDPGASARRAGDDAAGLAHTGAADSGLALGAWGAVQASCAGLAIALSGVLRDGFNALATHGALGPALTGPAVGYGVVYAIEIVLLFATLAAIGPLVHSERSARAAPSRFGLAEFPG